MLRQAILAAVVLCCLPTTAGLTQEARGDRSLLVKAKELTPELVLAVAKIGQEKIIPAEPGSDILKLISEYCGTSNARRYFLPLFIAANSGNAEIAAGKTILAERADLKMPACLFANETLAAAPVSPGGGPNWGRLNTVTTASLERAEAASGGPSGDAGIWRPHVPGSGRSIEIAAGTSLPNGLVVPKPLNLPGQSVDARRLESMGAAPVPDVLMKLGPGIVFKHVDSERLSDPLLKFQYEKLVRNTIAAAKLKPLSDQINQNVALNSKGFETAIRTQDILVANTEVDFGKLGASAKILASTFSADPHPVALKEGVNPEEAAKELQIASADPSFKVTEASEFLPFFGIPQDGNDPACTNVQNRPWPYEFQELKRVLELRKQVERVPRVGKVLVLDTGFPESRAGRPPFDAQYFVKRVFNPGRQPLLWTGNPGQYFYANAERASHGVSVLTMALGGVEALKSKILMTNVDASGGQIVSFNGYKPRGGSGLDIDSTSVSQALIGTWPAPIEWSGFNLMHGRFHGHV
jgi:hypothetical protein